MVQQPDPELTPTMFTRGERRDGGDGHELACPTAPSGTR